MLEFYGLWKYAVNGPSVCFICKNSVIFVVSISNCICDFRKMMMMMTTT
jgi:hypothetical protein